MTQETFEQMVKRVAHRSATQYKHTAEMGLPKYLFSSAHLIDFATRLRDELAKNQKPIGWLYTDAHGTHYTDDKREWYDAVGIEEVTPVYARPFVAAPAGVPDGWLVEGLVNDIKFKDQEIADLRAKKFARFRNEDCWIYQGDGEDHLESLVCPVVISPQALMELLSAAPAAPADAVAKDAEAEYAIKESRRINSCEEYFGARPQIDCLDRRRVFEAGFDRGYDAAPSSAQEPDHYCVTRGDGECISNHPLCMHNRATMQGKESWK